jgi:glycosyltransferase involved in cell wall biosynthesis
MPTRRHDSDTVSSLVYISGGSIPSRSANSIQVMKMSQAFAKICDNFELLVLGDLWSWISRRRFDFWTWYGIEYEFRIRRLPLLFQASYPFKRHYRHTAFPLFATLYTRLKSPHLVYTRDWQVATICLLCRQKVLVERHGFVKDDFFRQPMFRSGNFMGCVTISDRLAENFRQNGLDEKRITVEQDAVDLDMFDAMLPKETARETLDLPRNRTIVLYAGHFYRSKGVHTLLEAAKKAPDLLCVLVGGWEEHILKIQSMIDQEKIHNVWLTGFVSQAEIPLYLSAADILVLPSSPGRTATDKNTSPLKLFEYMAARRPIVASKLPNVERVLADGKSGLLVEPDNPDVLIQGIRHLLANPELASKLAEKARDLVVTKYNWDARARRILDFALSQQPPYAIRS